MLTSKQAQDFSNDPLLEGDGWASEGPDDKQFFEFICKSYPPWLDGNDDTPSLDAELEQNFGMPLPRVAHRILTVAQKTETEPTKQK